MELTYDKLKAIVLGKGYKWIDEPLYPMLVGIRTTLLVPNVYNDVMCVCYVTDKGEKKMFSYTQTTLPGKFWLNNPSRPEGCAVLVPGQYFAWVKGTHGHTRPHNALVQFGGPVCIVRDNDKDDLAEWEKMPILTNQYIGCNIHASWAIGDRKFIDKDSAACQVGSNSWNHEQMMKQVDLYIIKKLGRMPSNTESMNDPKSQVVIGYTLLLEKDLK